MQVNHGGAILEMGGGTGMRTACGRNHPRFTNEIPFRVFRAFRSQNSG
jgi:hypothetical protein